jgi:ATP synthase subunit 6
MKFFSPLEQFDAIFLKNFFYTEEKFLFWDICFIDFSFIHIIVPLIIVLLLFLIVKFFLSFFTLIPTTIFQRLLEHNLKFLLNLIKQQIGVIGYKYTILIFCIFFGILILNLLSVLPFGVALTSHLIVILFLSLSICVGIFIEGNIVLGFEFYKLFLPKSPIVMLPLLLLIEIFSYIIRMFSLAIRLVANIMAGHTLIYIISSFSLMIYNINFFFLFIGISLICIIMLLELGVACLQAYVFTILVLIYINDIYGGSH